MKKNIIGSLSSAVRKRLIDTFDRSNSASVGISLDGSNWNSLRGTFSISGNKAVGADANYPMVTQSFPASNQEINISGTTGAAASLWVTDSGNWWAVGITQEPTNCNCTYYYNTSYYNYTSNCVGSTPGNYVAAYYNGTWNSSNCAATSCNAYNASNCSATAPIYCASYNGSNCNNYAYNTTNKSTRCSGSYNASNCASYTGGQCTAYNTATCAAYTCNMYNGSNSNGNLNSAYTNATTYYYYSCTLTGSTQNGPYASCSTCYPQYVRVLQSVAGTVSVIASTALSALAQSFKIKTTGSQITVSAYSDPSLVTQIDSNLVYTPTGVTITPISGITVIPSTYGQQYSIDSVEIKTN